MLGFSSTRVRHPRLTTISRDMTHQIRTALFQGGFKRSTLDQTRSAFQKCLGPVGIPLKKKRRLKRPMINQSSLRKARAWGEGLQSLVECQSRPCDTNARFLRYPRQASSTNYHIQRYDTPDQNSAVAQRPAGRREFHLLDWYNRARHNSSLGSFKRNTIF